MDIHSQECKIQPSHVLEVYLDFLLGLLLARALDHLRVGWLPPLGQVDLGNALAEVASNIVSKYV